MRLVSDRLNLIWLTHLILILRIFRNVSRIWIKVYLRSSEVWSNFDWIMWKIMVCYWVFPNCLTGRCWAASSNIVRHWCRRYPTTCFQRELLHFGRLASSGAHLPGAVPWRLRFRWPTTSVTRLSWCGFNVANVFSTWTVVTLFSEVLNSLLLIILDQQHVLSLYYSRFDRLIYQLLILVYLFIIFCRLDAYLKDSRNLKRIDDTQRRHRLLHQGKVDIVAFINKLPKTTHDPTSLTVDVPVASNHLMVASVTGLFREREQQHSTIRFFQRVFVIVPFNEGFCIVNEQYHIMCATPEQVKNAFKGQLIINSLKRLPSSFKGSLWIGFNWFLTSLFYIWFEQSKSQSRRRPLQSQL